MERVDVVVVGGGPAGASAARAAADGGASTAVFEKGVPREDRAGLGPDSTDAAGILDYWVDLMQLDPRELPEDIIYRELENAEFIGPTERVVLRETGIPASYPHFGFTYDRAAFDDWLRERAEAAGAAYHAGTTVTDVTTTTDDPAHTISFRDRPPLEARYLILADGPQRPVTMNVLEQFIDSTRLNQALETTSANHIAYQEYRRFPEELFEPTSIKFWWGHMPGHTAYPWVFPNDGTVARVGLTMPIGLELDTVDDRDDYKLLDPTDTRIPAGSEYIKRLLRHEYPEYDLADFPIVEDRGKRQGTETYPISSTRPIDSPTLANIAVTGGAMGATSAFHEGGGHLAVRTGSIAGALAAQEQLGQYNAAWKDAVGEEIRRNAAMADLVHEYGPADWDRAFAVANRLVAAGVEDGIGIIKSAAAAGVDGVRIAYAYRKHKFHYRNGRYVQIREAEYDF